MASVEPIGPFLRRLRKAEGWSQTQAGEHLCADSGRDTVTKGEWSRWERGKRKPVEWLPELAKLFNVPLAHLEAAVAAARRREVPGATRDQERELGDYAAAVRDTNAHLIALDSRYGGTGVADVALQAFRVSHAALATGRHNSDEHDLEAATGETGEIAAWCLYDAARLDESRAVTHEAMMISRLAADRSMELFQLSHLALIDVHQRRSRDALRISENVMDPGGIAPRVEALFKIRAARALAQSGDSNRSLARLNEVASALQDSVHPHDPHWTWWLDESELAVQRGLLYLELGDYTTAVPHIAEAARLRPGPYNPVVGGGSVADYGDQRGRAAYNDLVLLLLVLTMAAAWSDAETAAADVASFARDVTSGRTELMLQRATKKIVDAAKSGLPDRPSATLADLAEELSASRH